MRSDLVVFGTRINMASRVRRRLLVLCIYAFTTALFVASWRAKHEFDILLIVWIPLLNRLIFGGGPYTSGLVAPFTKVRPIWLRSDPPPPSRIDRWFWARAPRIEDITPDERDLARRDRAHVISHAILGTLFYLCCFALWLHRSAPIFGETAISDDWAFGLTITGVVLWQTLPQAILLWTEPDMEEPQAS